MSKLIVLVLTVAALVTARPSYTAYSGATGSKGTCASSCHGSGTGTIVVTGFPQTYTPGLAYTITVKHAGGSTISNFNCSSRKGTTSTVAGTFAAVTNAATYFVTGNESGVRASSNSTDSSRFIWNAPAVGTGTVTLYVSGMQGTKSGPTTKVILTATENLASAVPEGNIPAEFSLQQNFPNPFNPSTVIRFSIPKAGPVELTLSDLVGNRVRTLFSGIKERGTHSLAVDLSWTGDGSRTALSSGVYFYTLRSGGMVLTKKLVFVK